MTSKHGDPVLVSLLQYMKCTDSRIEELDKIVSEVKESEEWEAVQMNIYQIWEAAGEAKGEAKGKAEMEEDYVNRIVDMLTKHPEKDDLELAMLLQK